MKNILFVVYKATSELDYILPIIWKIKKEHLSVKVYVFYAVLNKKMIIRESKFYSNILRKNNVNEYDFSDFIIFPFRIFRFYIRRLFSFSFWDMSELRFWKNNKNIIFNHFITFIFKWYRRFLRIVNLMLMRFVNFNYLFRFFNPHIIFFPLRNYTFYGKEKFYQYTYENKVKVILYPHSPFPSNGRYAVHYGVKKLNNGKVLPKFCRLWYAFSKELTPTDFPGLKEQSFLSGYPGLDTEWFTYLKSINKRAVVDDNINCLFITRRFVVRKPNDGSTDYIYIHEFIDMLQDIVKALKRVNKDIKLIIKPHPQNDFRSIEKIMQTMNYDNWEITYEPIYEAITNIEFVVSIYSGITIVPFIYGLPVILLDSSVTALFEKWVIVKDLFSGALFYVKDSKEIYNTIKKLIFHAKEKNIKNLVKKSQKHFRKYFPDKALERCITEIKKYMVKIND